MTQPSVGGMKLIAIPSNSIQDSKNALSVGGASNLKESLEGTLRIFTLSRIKRQQKLLMVRDDPKKMQL